MKWFTHKSQVLLAGKAPDISVPDYGMFVCSPPELRRLLLRESARHFHRAFELLGLFLFALRCDLKRNAKSSILSLLSRVSAFQCTKGNNSCPQSNTKKSTASSGENKPLQPVDNQRNKDTK